MELNGTHKFSANRQAVWDALHNSAALQHCIPGAEQIAWQANAIAARVNVGIGPLKGTFDGQVSVVENTIPSTVRLALNRSGSRGSVQSEAQITLTDDGAGTLLTYRGTATLTGQLAIVDNFVGKQAADLALGQFFKCLEGQIR
jgi:carbon monoxide dehydrogenase subunit G